MALVFERCPTLPLFQSAQHGVRRAWNLTAIAREEFARARAFVSTDPVRGWGQTGFMLMADGELVNLFNRGRPGDGRLAVGHAIAHGATHLNCYDGFLTDYYALLGFIETGRVPFNEALAPAGWDYTARGRPDVVFMALAPQHVSSYAVLQPRKEIAHVAA